MPKEFRMKAEPGEFKVVGGGSGFFSNAATIAIESFKAPLEESIIIPDEVVLMSGYNSATLV